MNEAGIFVILCMGFLETKSSIFIPQIAFQHQENQVCSLFWWALMWTTGDFKNRPENTLIFENCIPDDNSSEAFSIFCFNASTDSSFELASVDPLKNLKNCFVWVIIWNSAGELLEVQTALFLVFTRIKWTFAVRVILFSFLKKTTDLNKTAAFNSI